MKKIVCVLLFILGTVITYGQPLEDMKLKNYSNANDLFNQFWLMKDFSNIDVEINRYKPADTIVDGRNEFKTKINFAHYNVDNTGASTVNDAIEAVLDSAGTYDLDIWFPRGVYGVSKSFVIPKGVSLYGDSSVFVVRSSIVGSMFSTQGYNTIDGIHLNGNYLTRIGIYNRHNNLQVRNCKIYGFKVMNGNSSAGIWSEGNNTVVDSCIICDIRDTLCSSASAGIVIKGNIVNAKINANTIYRIGNPGCDADGIKIQNITFNNPNSYGNLPSYITNNKIIVDGKRAIKIQASMVTVNNNWIESYLEGANNQSTYSGISVIYGDSVTISNNRIKLLRSKYGINAERGKYCTITDNYIEIDIVDAYTTGWNTPQRAVNALDTKGLTITDNQVYSANEAIRGMGDTLITVSGNHANTRPYIGSGVMPKVGLNYVNESIYLGLTNKREEWGNLAGIKNKVAKTRRLKAEDFTPSGYILYITTTCPILTLPAELNNKRFDMLIIKDMGKGTVILDASAVTLLDSKGVAILNTGKLKILEASIEYLSSDTYQIIGEYSNK